MAGVSMDASRNQTNDVIILGAGLAGLGAGYALSISNSSSAKNVLVIEAGKTVGGLAITKNHHGFRFDLGGHRFKTSKPKIEQLVRNIMGHELLVVKRSSKILLRDKYFDYPLKPLNAISGFGIPTTAKIILEYAAGQLKQPFVNEKIVSLEDWVVHHFGRTLFNIYFREYSEKVWGINCNRICMEWMEQRIQKLSLGKAIKKALFKNNNKDIHTLASEFLYPSLGIGRIASRLKQEIEKNNTVLTNSRVVRINHNGNRIENVTTRSGPANNKTGNHLDNQTYHHGGNEFISSIPVATLVQLLHPRPPTEILEAASKLKYRDLVIVTIMLNRERVTDQTWIYLPEQKIPFGRIHEPTNWSSKMAPPGKTLLVTEHFCFRGDKTWSASDEELAEKTINSLMSLGFIKRHEVLDKVVLRIPRAYPLFEVGYTKQLEKICKYLDRFHNLRLIGRGGMFRYYNMDHTLESGISAAESLMAARPELFNPELLDQGRNENFQTGTDS